MKLKKQFNRIQFNYPACIFNKEVKNFFMDRVWSGQYSAVQMQFLLYTIGINLITEMNNQTLGENHF